MTTVLPNHILRLVPAIERAKMGKAGLTADECFARAEIRNERDLQKLLVNYLRQKQIEPIVSIFGRKTTNNIGTPDILFAVFVDGQITACAWEVKTKSGKLTMEQHQMALRLSMPPNGWRHRVIRSFDEARKELQELGL